MTDMETKVAAWEAGVRRKAKVQTHAPIIGSIVNTAGKTAEVLSAIPLLPFYLLESGCRKQGKKRHLRLGASTLTTAAYAGIIIAGIHLFSRHNSHSENPHAPTSTCAPKSVATFTP